MSGDILDFEADELEEFIQKYMEFDRGVQNPKESFRYFRVRGRDSTNTRSSTS